MVRFHIFSKLKCLPKLAVAVATHKNAKYKSIHIENLHACKYS